MAINTIPNYKREQSKQLQNKIKDYLSAGGKIDRPESSSRGYATIWSRPARVAEYMDNMGGE